MPRPRRADGQSRVLHSVNFVAGATDAADACGHGTHVAGIIAGDGAASTGPRFFHTFLGIAPKTSLVNVRVLDAQGSSDVGTVLAGLQWVDDHKKQFKIRVVNLSLGHPVGESAETDPLCQAVEQLWHDGVVVVTAAGNMGRLNSDTQTPGWTTRATAPPTAASSRPPTTLTLSRSAR